MNELQNCDSGICIGSVKYNIYCYADDLLLSSTTVTGLQHLINKANCVISKIGLKFNPQKTECLIVGINPFTSMPQWYLNGASLSLSDSLTYLGTCLGDQRGQEHVAKRSQKASQIEISNCLTARKENLLKQFWVSLIPPGQLRYYNLCV